MSAMRLTTGKLAIVFAAGLVATGLAHSAAADEAFCNAYADEGAYDAAQNKTLGCGYTGRRWTTGRSVHFNVCMGWNADQKNGGMEGMNEFVNRAVDLAKCRASHTEKSPPFTGNSPFKGDDPPTLDSFCRSYAYISDRQKGSAGDCGFRGPLWESTFDTNLANCLSWGAQAGQRAAATVFGRTMDSTDENKCTGGRVGQACDDFASRMMAKVNEAQRLSCAFLKGSGGWNEPRDHWVKQCLRWKAGNTIKFQEDGLQSNLDTCKSGGGGTAGGGAVKVVKEVTMYDTYKSKNKDLCYLHPGDTLTKLSLDGATAPWMHLKGNSGNCNGKTGFVYNQGELK
jgi:hypothetical protein